MVSTIVSNILKRDSLSISMASRGRPSSALLMTARRMSSSEEVTLMPSAVERPTAGSASMARILEPGRSSVSTRTMDAASEVLPTPPFPASAIIFALLSPIFKILPYGPICKGARASSGGLSVNIRQASMCILSDICFSFNKIPHRSPFFKGYCTILFEFVQILCPGMSRMCKAGIKSSMFWIFAHLASRAAGGAEF